MKCFCQIFIRQPHLSLLQIPSEELVREYRDGTFVVLRLIPSDCMELD